jgi:steroid delta-isomerase-like uncharacterized protein
MRNTAILLVTTLICLVPCYAGEAENTRIVRTMVEAINDRDLDRLDSVVAADLVRHSAATAGVNITSLEAFKSFLRTDFAAVPDSVIDIDIIFGNDEYIGVRATYTGTQSGPMGPFPPSGKRVELPYLGILRLADGKISEMWVEWDNIYMLTQLGHLSPPDP